MALRMTSIWRASLESKGWDDEDSVSIPEHKSSDQAVQNAILDARGASQEHARPEADGNGARRRTPRAETIVQHDCRATPRFHNPGGC